MGFKDKSFENRGYLTTAIIASERFRDLIIEILTYCLRNEEYLSFQYPSKSCICINFGKTIASTFALMH